MLTLTLNPNPNPNHNRDPRIIGPSDYWTLGLSVHYQYKDCDAYCKGSRYDTFIEMMQPKMPD